MGFWGLGFDTFDIMVWARNFVIQNTWAEPNNMNPNVGFIRKGGGLVQIVISYHFRGTVLDLVLSTYCAQGRSFFRRRRKAPTWPRGVFFARGPLRRTGARMAVIALAGRAAHRRASRTLLRGRQRRVPRPGHALEHRPSPGRVSFLYSIVGGGSRSLRLETRALVSYLFAEGREDGKSASRPTWIISL